MPRAITNSGKMPSASDLIDFLGAGFFPFALATVSNCALGIGTFFSCILLSPSIYLYVSLTNENKRTDYPGSEIAYLIQNKWDKNFVNKITVIVGDEWAGGNLSYHLNSRPKWFSSLDNNLKKIEPNAGFVYVGNPNVLKKVCPGEYGVIKPIGVCMIGIK